MDEHYANLILQGAQDQLLPDGHPFSYQPEQIRTTVSLWFKHHCPQGFSFCKERAAFIGKRAFTKESGA